MLVIMRKTENIYNHAQYCNKCAFANRRFKPKTTPKLIQFPPKSGTVDFYCAKTLRLQISTMQLIARSISFNCVQRHDLATPERETISSDLFAPCISFFSPCSTYHSLNNNLE